MKNVLWCLLFQISFHVGLARAAETNDQPRFEPNSEQHVPAYGHVIYQVTQDHIDYEPIQKFEWFPSKGLTSAGVTVTTQSGYVVKLYEDSSRSALYADNLLRDAHYSIFIPNGCHNRALSDEEAQEALRLGWIKALPTGKKSGDRSEERIEVMNFEVCGTELFKLRRPSPREIEMLRTPGQNTLRQYADRSQRIYQARVFDRFQPSK